jgi:hypothetical protein
MPTLMAVELAIAAAGASRRELGHGEIRHILLIPLQLECFYPAGLICFLHSDLCANLWGIGVGINPAKMRN